MSEMSIGGCSQYESASVFCSCCCCRRTLGSIEIATITITTTTLATTTAQQLSNNNCCCMTVIHSLSCYTIVRDLYGALALANAFDPYAPSRSRIEPLPLLKFELHVGSFTREEKRNNHN